LYIYLRLAAVLLGLLLGAGPGGPLFAADRPLRVVATIKPVHSLVAAVMEGVGSPALLVTGARSPHTYALRPSDARALNEADVFFRVSEQVEPFTGKIVKSLPESVRVVTLADAPGLELLDVRTGDTFEAHGHGHGLGHGGEDADEDDDHAASHEPARRDGHVWLDPRNARAMVAEIARVLAETSPADAETLERNVARLTERLEALEAELARELAPVAGKPFVVFHDAYHYFERRFGLASLGSITVSPEVPPSARRLTEIRKKIAALGAACVFAEPQFQPRLVAVVTEGTGAHSGTLDPEGALIEPGPDGYFALMRALAAGLKGCLLAGAANGSQPAAYP
jgi:zinc transport system substrate-binding protein